MNEIMKKSCFLLIVGLSLLISVSCTQVIEEKIIYHQVERIESNGKNLAPVFTGNIYADEAHCKRVPLINPNGYVMRPDGTVATIDLYFPVTNEGITINQIPYINLKWFLNSWYYDNKILSVSRKGNIIRFEATPSGYMEFDAENQTFLFSNYNALLQNNNKATFLDFIVFSFIRAQAVPVSFERNGNPILIDLKKYGIPVYAIGTDIYLPLQTFFDVFVDNTVHAYNGNAIYIYDIPDQAWTQRNLGERSSYLKDFTYKEFCLKMDIGYGLKSIHNITSFNEFFETTNLKQDFYTNDPNDIGRVLYKLTAQYFADFHTSFVNNSLYASSKYVDYTGLSYSPAYVAQYNIMGEYHSKRNGFIIDLNRIANGTENGSVHDYREDGDTAYITFDDFYAGGNGTRCSGKSFGSIDLSDVTNTFDLITYAHQEISSNSSIKNVVIDLSCNGGGSNDVMAYILSWVLGHADLSYKHALTEAMATTVYIADINMDNTYTEDGDTLLELVKGTRKLKIYCIISPASFSCGNAVPAFFKNSDKVTLIGKKSGGGACVVMNMATADGAWFKTSSNNLTCYVKNGSFYQIDEGVEPDVLITNFDNVYNRTILAGIINGLK